MTLSTRAGLAVPVVLLAVACGGNGGAPCDGNGTATYCIPVGDDGYDGSFTGGDASTGTLDAHIDQNGIQVTFVTLDCAGECATVEAVATGGNPPYAFAWSDGSTTATRSVCPTSNTSYQVTVTDTGTTGEFTHPPQTAKVSLAAQVLACPDAGAPFPSGPCDSLAKTFSAKGVNPDGTWSYGWSSTVGAAFTLYPTFAPQELDAGAYTTPGFPSVAQWFDPSQGTGGISSTGPVPDIQFNATAMPVHPGVGNFTGDSWIVGPGQVVMSPSIAGLACSVARWTAPRAGTYGVKAAFASAATPGYTDIADVYVEHNGAAIGSATGGITASATSFAVQSSVTVAAGDTIDFVVGPGSGLTYRLVSVDAQVCTSAGVDGG
jgi:hypothetical protein